MVISKLDAAYIQLNKSIECFFKDDHICAITLCGAAEDILSGLLSAEGEQSPFEFLHDWYQETYKTEIKKQDFSREVLNASRNWLKHAQNDSTTECDISERDSLSMLMRAVPCYCKLTKENSDDMKKFVQYVQCNREKINALFP